MRIVIPEFEAEAFIAAYQLLNERDVNTTILDLFPREQHVGDKVKIAQFFEKAQRVRHTSFDGRSMPIPRGYAKEIEYTPSVIKLNDQITSSDIRKYFEAQARVPASVAGVEAAESLQRAQLSTVESIRDRIVRAMRMSNDTERRALCAGAMQGAYSYKVADQAGVKTVDLNLTTFDPPGTSWDDEDANIIEDISDAYSAFKNANNDGVAPTHVFYSPKKIRGALLKNTQLREYMKQNPELAAWFIGLRAGTSVDWLDMDGRIRDLFGLTWVPMEGTFRDLDDQVQDLWNPDYITFAKLGEGGCDPKWFMTYDPAQNPEPDVNIEVSAPAEGSDVKAWQVVLFDNGLPGFKRPDLVMTQRVIAGA